MVSVIILAAGESKRMGQPKLLLPLGQKTILEHTIDNFLDSEVGQVIVVVGENAEEMSSLVADRPVKIAVNPVYRQGMSTSIITGLSLVDDKAKAVMLALADQPFINSQVINKLIEEFYNHSKGIVVPTCEGKKGHPVIFSMRFKEELLALRGDIGGREIIKGHPDDILEVAVSSESIGIDIDNISDYQSLLS